MRPAPCFEHRLGVARMASEGGDVLQPYETWSDVSWRGRRVQNQSVGGCAGFHQTPRRLGLAGRMSSTWRGSTRDTPWVVGNMGDIWSLRGSGLAGTGPAPQAGQRLPPVRRKAAPAAPRAPPREVPRRAGAFSKHPRVSARGLSTAPGKAAGDKVRALDSPLFLRSPGVQTVGGRRAPGSVAFTRLLLAWVENQWMPR